MKLDLFSNGDKVLLVGEGNLSFSVCLLKHKLPISIIATCFESEGFYKNQEANVAYLKSENVPIFFNVDATKLHENENFHGKCFTKVIFNFPHTGKKMKIQLNRELLKGFFKSVRHVLAEDGGSAMVSLCRGQGGTPFDRPQRNWNDSWQVTEMAGHGGFTLTDVHPFCKDRFGEYTCVGYRSRDVRFNLDGALVHVFARREIPFERLNARTPFERTNLIPLSENANLFVPAIYSEMHANNPLSNPKSPHSFVRSLIVDGLSEGLSPARKLKTFTDREIPLHVSSKNGVRCQINLSRTEWKLRESPLNVLRSAVELHESTPDADLVFHSGLYFSSAFGKDLSGQAPIKIRFLILGDRLLNSMVELIEKLIFAFEEAGSVGFSRTDGLSGLGSDDFPVGSINSIYEIICRNEGRTKKREFVAATVYSLNLDRRNVEACVVNVDEICQESLGISSWKEMWSVEKGEISFGKGGKPFFNRGFLLSPTYSFDITLRHGKGKGFAEEKMCELLWLAAGNLVERIELVSEYDSGEDWSSKCYRITYKSFGEPVHRKKIIEIQEKLIGPMLEVGLNVSVH